MAYGFVAEDDSHDVTVRPPAQAAEASSETTIVANPVQSESGLTISSGVNAAGDRYGSRCSTWTAMSGQNSRKVFVAESRRMA
jgi:hypothetical protein